jgi:predicted RNase H-like HicB family nuclease
MSTRRHPHVIRPDLLCVDKLTAFFEHRQTDLFQRIGQAMGKPIETASVSEPVEVVPQYEAAGMRSSMTTAWNPFPPEVLMAGEFTVIIERDDEGFLVANVPALHGCHTQARTMDQLLQRVREAVELCLEDAGQDAEQPLEFVGIQRVAV